ncbi:MAG: hypothetical protein L3J62_05635 [Gammaproteobacteria bacterium]|nr:hypothetical protein [Gammaproteobacteria bacterium]MCF6230262.1 hypothetical protein [Gammaproteobacteria bacterium]
MKYLKLTGLFIVLFLVMALDMSNSFIGRLGFEANYLATAAAALLIAWLTMNHSIVIMLLVVILATAASLSGEAAASIGYDRDIVLALLIAIIVAPMLRKLLDME